MTGTEAKEIREYYGFSLSELAEILGYSQKQAIHRIEKMEEVPNNYRFSINSLRQKCNLINFYIREFINSSKITKQEYQVFYYKQRIIKINIKKHFSESFYMFMRLFHFKKIFTDKNTNLSCFVFDYTN